MLVGIFVVDFMVDALLHMHRIILTIFCLIYQYKFLINISLVAHAIKIKATPTY